MRRLLLTVALLEPSGSHDAKIRPCGHRGLRAPGRGRALPESGWTTRVEGKGT